MVDIEKIIEVTHNLYQQKNSVIDWNKWVESGHNAVVDYWVQKIAEKEKFDVEACRMSAYLHDIAYSWTSKNDPSYEDQSLDKAREILRSEGVGDERVKFIVDDILAGHGMHDGKSPDLIEARVFATADAMAHFTTDFYLVMAWNNYLFEGKNLEDYKTWVLKKIERDFNNKILFDEFKEVARPYYEALRKIFNSPNTLKY